MGLQPRIFGLETYDPEQQYIYVANHQSFIDVLCKFAYVLKCLLFSECILNVICQTYCSY